LEKKIYEYEKKLVELKGGNETQMLNNSKGSGNGGNGGGNKVNTLTATLIERVLQDSKK
jgi:hypothetical protein